MKLKSSKKRIHLDKSDQLQYYTWQCYVGNSFTQILFPMYCLADMRWARIHSNWNCLCCLLLGKIVTIDGDNCELPVYYFGVLRHECVDIYGVPSCKTAGGVWKECAASDANVKIKKKTKVEWTTIFF